MSLRTGNPELVADRSGHRVLNLLMSGDGRASAVVRIAVDGMPLTFAVEMTSLAFEMADQIPPFHAGTRSTVTVSQMASPDAARAAWSR